MAHFMLRSEIFGLAFDDLGSRIAVQIPTTAELFVVDPVPKEPPANATETINVFWNGRSMMVFLIDLQERGIPIIERRSAVGAA